MLHTVLAHLRAQWAGFIALFLALAGGVAYAANTVGSADVIDNSLQSADLRNNQAVQTADVRNGSLNDEDVGERSSTSRPSSAQSPNTSASARR